MIIHSFMQFDFVLFFCFLIQINVVLCYVSTISQKRTAAAKKEVNEAYREIERLKKP